LGDAGRASHRSPLSAESRLGRLHPRDRAMAAASPRIQTRSRRGKRPRSGRAESMPRLPAEDLI